MKYFSMVRNFFQELCIEKEIIIMQTENKTLETRFDDAQRAI